MQFTPQQLAGGPRFSSLTRIGNWQEEIALDEAKVSNFQSRSSSGSLLLRKMELKISICSEIVPHTYSEDGIIRFGDTIILQHDSTSSVLACDPFDEIISGQSKYLVSTVDETPQPKARNVFRIVRPPAELCNFSDNLNDQIVHIGQSFMLACNESLLMIPGSKLLNPTLYLSSTKKNERMATKRTNRQLVYMSPQINAESIWIAILPSKGRLNSSERFLAMGEHLNVHNSFQITHRQTNMYLSCDPKTKSTTEFGIELECFADRSTAPGKLGLMISEFEGYTTSQTLAKPDAPIFSWHFLPSKDRQAGIDNRKLPPSATSETILLEVQEQIKLRGLDAFWNLRDFFKQSTNKLQGGTKLDREDLKSCLLDWGITTPTAYLDTMVDLCDDGKLGLIDISDFISLLRGPLNSFRENLLSNVFTKIDKSKQGYISISEIEQNFIGKNHPLVTIGGYTEKEALKHILKAFEIHGKLPTKVSFMKFCSYYADLSATIDDDNYFESIVIGNWRNIQN